MNRILHLKHWQVFLLMFGLPFLFQIVTVPAALNEHVGTFMLVTSVSTAIYGLLFFSWFWALGTNLYEKLPPTVKMNLGKFKAFLIMPIIYLIVLFPLMYLFIPGQNGSPTDQPPAAVGLLIPVHLFAMFCLFYCLYFVAKVLKSVEWQRSVTFSDYAGEFFLIWFFPIGIWFIQPRINKLFDETNEIDNFLNSSSPL